MKIHRFHTEQELREHMTIRESDIVHQLTRVLRLAPGDSIILFNGNGMEWKGRITEIRKTGVEAEQESVAPNEREPKRKVDLYAAVLKRENFEWVVQKATEIGAHSIHPVITERTVKLKLNPERLRKIALEAAEQSGRNIVPEVAEPVPAADAFVAAEGYKLFFDPEGGELHKKEGAASVFIGPEGGWSDAEKEAAKRAGCSSVRLGRTILRAETAAILGVHQVLL